MKERGYLLYPVKEPTVPKGTARFRIGLNPYITYEEIEKFVEELSMRLILFFNGWGMDSSVVEKVELPKDTEIKVINFSI